MNKQHYPLGQQDFAGIRNEGKVYIDKTALIHNLVNGSSKYVFLSRPRRFGKSLLISTIQYFFEGRKELFKGLAIYELEKDWVKHPVLHLELSRINSVEPDSLISTIDQQFSIWEKKYDIISNNSSLSSRFADIIIHAYEKTQQPVVILIDEYDNPLINTINHQKLHDHNRELLKSIYSNLKALDRYIRFAMLTGVSRFSRTSVFSGLNNITDISFYDRFSSICGFTEDEIRSYLYPGIQKMSLYYECTPEEMIFKLKNEYDGYHFSKRCPDLYNPYSLLMALDKQEMGNFWVETATPEFLVRKLKASEQPFASIFNEYADTETLSETDNAFTSPVALLFQTGYLTIKSYDNILEAYKVGIPNREVRKGLFGYLMTHLLEKDRIQARTNVMTMAEDLTNGNPEKFFQRLESFLASVPYTVMPKMPELYFEHALYIILQMTGLETEAEVGTSNGRIDLIVKTEKFIYIMEFKLDKDSQIALNQIEEKEYSLPYKFDGRKIFKIGVNFSSKTRNITAWEIIGK